MFVIQYKKFFIGLSAFFVAISLVFLFLYGLPLGIDFKGGSQLEISYVADRPELATLKADLATAGFADLRLQTTGTHGVTIKSRDLSDAEHERILQVASRGGSVAVVEDNFITIGPSVGAELRKKAIVSIVVVLTAIILFVAYAFRKVSRPVSSWKYGVAVIVALIHDIAIPTGAFALLGHLYGVELDTLFVVALLTTLALSISDTIVVFDRIREHLKTKSTTPFPQLVGESLSETFARSINTSLTVLIMVITLAIVGPESTRLFATVLAIGMFFGTYSSIFLASPLLVVFESLQKKQGKKNA